jgi:dihydrofolate synthase/folylpolyglutamate synthase
VEDKIQNMPGYRILTEGRRNMPDYKSTVEYILDIPLFAKKIGKENLSSLLCRLGNPEWAVPAIHVAGTNGKGSVCKALAQVLEEAGYKVGLFTSPHLVDINERIQINGRNISNEDFTEIFWKIKEEFQEHPSFFEVMFAMAAVYFQREECDYAIYETGMGGRLDATNVLKPQLTIITSVGMDHMEYLGDTIEKIAAEKAGIIKPDVPMIYFMRDEKVNKVIEQRAKQVGAPIISVGKEDYIINHLDNKTIDFSLHSRYYSYCKLKIPKTSLCQVENMSLVALAFSYLMEKKNQASDVTEKVLKNGLSKFYWEGRMEQILPGVYIDGAHNVEAITAYVDTVNRLYKGKRRILVFAAVKDKEYSSMIELLVTRLELLEVIVTSVGGERKAASVVLAEQFRKVSNLPVFACDDLEKAMDLAMEHKAGRDDVEVYCVGSLYLVGGIKRWRNSYDKL